MGILRDFQRIVLALIAVSVVALYGTALAFPADRAPEAVVEWVPLPRVAPIVIASATLPTPGMPDFDAVSADQPSETTKVAELRDKFSAASFDINSVRRGGQPVPRLFADALPPDFNSLTEVDKLKQTFFQMVLPLTLKVNEEILADRHQLLLIEKRMAAGRALSSDQQQWLAELAARYDASPDDVSELLHRVDVISPSLAIAQSAEESGWGRSRFALKGNALFGQKTWDKGLGIVPRKRDDDGRYEVRVFPSLLDSVRSYANNLNGHPAYDEFRARRAEMRALDGTLDPYGLIETLSAYSERREEYIRTIQKIIRVDSLEELEATRLEGRPIETTQVLSRERLR